MTYVVSFHRDWSGYSQDNRGKEFGMAEVYLSELSDGRGEIYYDDEEMYPGDIVLQIREKLAKDLKTGEEHITILNFWRRWY